MTATLPLNMAMCKLVAARVVDTRPVTPFVFAMDPCVEQLKDHFV